MQHMQPIKQLKRAYRIKFELSPKKYSALRASNCSWIFNEESYTVASANYTSALDQNSSASGVVANALQAGL